MINSLDVSIRNIVSVLLDGFSIVILLVVIVTMPAIPTHKENNYKKTFLTCVIIGILSAVFDIVSYTLMYEMEKRVAYSIVCYIDNVLILLCSLFSTIFTIRYVSISGKINKYFKYTLITVYTVLFFTHMIPGIYRQIYYVPNDKCELVYGPWNMHYCVALLFAESIPILAMILNIKKFRIKEWFTLFLLQVLPIFAFIFIWGEIASSFFLMSLFMLVAYILVYQGRLWDYTEREKEFAESELKLLDMKTKVMLSQVQPHFLYNTLSSIAYYCKREPELANELTMEFSAYLRNNIDSLDGNKSILFSRELEHTKNYLNIEKVRFGDRLNVEYDIQFSNFEVPSLILQPIVENAVKHGICIRENGGTVKISTVKTEKFIIITVWDDGVGFDTKKVSSDGQNHVGLKNVKDRLENLLGGKMTIKSKLGKGTEVQMYIPVKN